MNSCITSTLFFFIICLLDGFSEPNMSFCTVVPTELVIYIGDAFGAIFLRAVRNVQKSGAQVIHWTTAAIRTMVFVFHETTDRVLTLVVVAYVLLYRGSCTYIIYITSCPTVWGDRPVMRAFGCTPLRYQIAVRCSTLITIFSVAGRTSGHRSIRSHGVRVELYLSRFLTLTTGKFF